MAQRYDVVLDAQLGKRFGTLILDNEGGQVKGTFCLLGFENLVSGRCIDGHLALKHELRTALSTLDCETHAEVREDTLMGTVMSQYGRMKLYGKKTGGRMNGILGRLGFQA